MISCKLLVLVQANMVVCVACAVCFVKGRVQTNPQIWQRIEGMKFSSCRVLVQQQRVIQTFVYKSLIVCPCHLTSTIYTKLTRKKQGMNESSKQSNETFAYNTMKQQNNMLPISVEAVSQVVVQFVRPL